MPPKNKPNLSKEEKARKKSAAAKAILEKIKSDPILLAEYKEKERLKYLKKKEKGHRKSIQDMTPREQRIIRKQWKKYSIDYRKKKTIRKDCENYVAQNTPPTSENDENIPPERQINDNNNENLRQVEAKRRSRHQRKIRNKILQEKCAIIDDLKKKLNTQQKKYSRLKRKIKKSKKVLTPKSKIEQMADDPNQSRELVKKALFGEVLQAQITENILKARTHQEKSNFKQLLTGPKVEKYKLWRQDCNSILYNKIRRKASKRNVKTKTDSEEDIPLQNLRQSETTEQAGISKDLKDKMKVTYSSGDYLLVKFMVKRKEYRYAAICSSYDDEEGELTVTFLKVYNKEGNLFKLDEGDVADVLYEDVIGKLSMPSLIVKGDSVLRF